MAPVDLDTIVTRAALAGTAETYSGATLERAELADGRRVVLKHLPADGDWLTRATGGHGRARLLWDSGLLPRLARAVDHTVIDMIACRDHDVVVMRDAGRDLLPPRVAVERDQSRRLLAGLAVLHRVADVEPVDGLCPIGARYGLFAPAFHNGDRPPGVHPLRDRIAVGWDHFAEQVPGDVVDVVGAVHRDPSRLGARLGSFPPVLLHGDAKLENLGLSATGLVAIDWGDLTGFGPVEVELGWYALLNGLRLTGTPGDVFDDYEAVTGWPLEREAVDLVCVGSLAQGGFFLAGHAVVASRPEVRARAADVLAWWTARVREAMDRLGSL